MQTGPGQCLDASSQISLTSRPFPKPIKYKRSSSYLIWLTRLHTWLLMTSLASSFAVPPLHLGSVFWWGVKSFESKNVMILIHVYVKFCINIHEVLSSLPPNQGLKVRTYSHSIWSLYSNQNYPCVCYRYLALPIPLPETLPCCPSSCPKSSFRSQLGHPILPKEAFPP